MCRKVERNHEKMSKDSLSLRTGKTPTTTDPNAMLSTDVSITIKISPVVIMQKQELLTLL
jgi:hypothetical protein